MTICSLLVMAIDCLSLSLGRGDLLLFWSWPSTVSLSLLVIAIDCLSLLVMAIDCPSFSPGHGHRLSLSPGHGHRLSLSPGHGHRLSLSPGHGHRLSLSLLVVGIWLSLFGHDHRLSISSGHGHRLSLSLSMGKGYLPLPLRGLWTVALSIGFSGRFTLLSLSLSVGDEHLLVFSSDHCHLFSICFSAPTTAGCSLLFGQKKQLVSLASLGSSSFCHLNLSTSVPVPLVVAMTCINLN